MAPQQHPQFTKSDYDYLSGKGYTDAEIVALWNRDQARGEQPLTHRPAVDVVGYLNQ